MCPHIKRIAVVTVVNFTSNEAESDICFIQNKIQPFYQQKLVFISIKSARFIPHRKTKSLQIQTNFNRVLKKTYKLDSFSVEKAE